MVLRTSKTKVALVMRVVAVLGIVVPYVLISMLSTSVKYQVNLDKAENVLENTVGRQLLAVPTPEERNCTPPAIDEFPSDGLTREQRKQGWVVLHALLACYCFILLAIVCDDYFVPAIKRLCDSLQLAEDVTGATFMAVASSSPELFINCVGTFITEGDLGVGTIVGSAVFNILAVPACCGLFSNMVLQLSWWPITRDSLMYGVAVVMLIFTLWDEKVYWYEAFMLVSAYTLYIIAMCFNGCISRFAHRCMKNVRGGPRYVELPESTPLLGNPEKANLENGSTVLQPELTLKDCEEVDGTTEIWKWPSESSFWGQMFWLFTWPIAFILYCTVLDCRKYPRFYIITFFSCIFWIGSTSYMTAWLITTIGDTIEIPDSVMGLTFLAAGTSVPEAVSSVIVTNQGFGEMGLSNSIGSNTFDILLCLGLPWLIKSWHFPTVPGSHFVVINSSGLTYSAISLLSTLVLLYGSFSCNHFKLNWKVGLTCLMMYVAFLCFASVIELNVFFPVNLPTCDR